MGQYLIKPIDKDEISIVSRSSGVRYSLLSIERMDRSEICRLSSDDRRVNIFANRRECLRLVDFMERTDSIPVLG